MFDMDFRAEYSARIFLHPGKWLCIRILPETDFHPIKDCVILFNGGNPRNTGKRKEK